MVKPFELPISLRPLETSDHPFVIDSWLESNFKNTSLGRFNVTKQFYTNEYTRIIKRILAQSSGVVACNKDNPAQILGFCVAEIVSHNKIVYHYIYVKHRARACGLGRLMFEQFRPELFERRYCSHNVDISLRRKFKVFLNPYEVHKTLIRAGMAKEELE